MQERLTQAKNEADRSVQGRGRDRSGELLMLRLAAGYEADARSVRRGPAPDGQKTGNAVSNPRIKSRSTDVQRSGVSCLAQLHR